jgi:predicted metalloprotease with PDZ domain
MRRFAAAFALVWTSCQASPELHGAPPSAFVEYTISFEGAKNHYVDIEAVFPNESATNFELFMPVWTPGSYMIREYARNLEGFAVSGDRNQPLAMEKSRKNRWRVQAEGHRTVRVKYRVYARALKVQSNWVDADFAMLNGAPTFLARTDDVLERTGRSFRVRLRLPPEWKQSITGLPKVGEGEHEYVASDYDVLIDSPFLVGNPAIYEFEVAGKKHYLVHQGEGGIWDGPASAQDVQRIVEEQHRFWGQLPYDNYFFLNVIEQGRGGLEHLNSTLMITNRWNSRIPKQYRKWLGLVSHEFFHTWNVKRLRPAALGPFDYEHEVHTKSLWIAEGLTSYYDDLLLRRTNLFTEKEYLEALSAQIESVQNTPGRSQHPLEMTSFDTWIKFYHRDENSVNSTVSYYKKGAIVGFLLDAKIREATNGEQSLDDVLRIAYERYAGPRGYTPEEFRKLISEVAKRDLEPWLHDALATTKELEYGNALAWFGLRFRDPAKKEKPSESEGVDAKPSPETKESPAVTSEGADSTPKKKPYLGVTTAADDGRLIVRTVLRDTPAHIAGLNVDDEILAIDEYRIKPSTWPTRLEQYEVGDTIDLLVARRERLLRFPLVLGAPPPKRWELEFDPDASEEQVARRSEWLSGRK